MMRIPTGKGSITLPALLAIWSVSLVVNLPGLAVSPMLGNLDKIFPTASDLEIQLLTVLPNLLIIPFVLFSGKLSESRDKVRIVVIGLAIYLVAGILYFFAIPTLSQGSPLTSRSKPLSAAFFPVNTSFPFR